MMLPLKLTFRLLTLPITVALFPFKVISFITRLMFMGIMLGIIGGIVALIVVLS